MTNEGIDLYGDCVDAFDASPTVLIEMLRRRSSIENMIHELTINQKNKLISYDLKLIENAKQMTEHIGKNFDFSLSEEPLTEWWWHLDKVASGKIEFYLSPTIEPDKDNINK
ncbi:hypothetical protein VBD025_02940 [Virgibacillus flavescens]|uniref:hypothetical protein n=1 Tax=Virgibacillus flavescens TaxID=1611422 RepID=UPI003D33DD54